MGDIKGKIVNFHYCTLCVHKDKKEDENPCDLCLEEPGGIDQRKPMYFKPSTDANKT